MINQQNKVEKICWCRSDKKIRKIFRIFSTNIKCTVGFIVDENDKILKISPTIGSQGFTDIIEIRKENIIFRKEFNHLSLV